MQNSMTRILQDKSLSMNQKMTYFMMFSDPNAMPHNPNHNDYHDLGVQIKTLITSNKIQLTHFDENFILHFKST